MPTTDIARPGRLESAEQIDSLRRALPALAADGNTDALLSIARDAGPASILLRKRELDDEANRLVRLKCEAEAELGLLETTVDIPMTRPGEGERRKQLAVAKERGVLSVIMDMAVGDLTTDFVLISLRRQGYSRVPVAATKAALEQWARKKGKRWSPSGRGQPTKGTLSIDAGAAELGLPSSSLRAALGRPKAEGTIRWGNAKLIAEGIGIDPASWPPAPGAYRKKRLRKRWLRRRLAPTGGRWDECYSRFRKCLDEFQRLAPNTDTRWDDAYAHFYALNAEIERAVRKA